MPHIFIWVDERLSPLDEKSSDRFCDALEQPFPCSGNSGSALRRERGYNSITTKLPGRTHTHRSAWIVKAKRSKARVVLH